MSIQYVLNVALTSTSSPAILYIDKWGRRPMLLWGSLLMGFWMFLVGGIQGRFGHWSTPDSTGKTVWIIQGNEAATKAVIVPCLFILADSDYTLLTEKLSYALAIGPVSWTYPAELYSLKASNWAVNTALAFAVPPGLNTIAWKAYFIFGTFNFSAFIHIFFMFPETVGRSLEEVEEIFQQGHTFTAWRIWKDVGKKTLAEVVEKSKVISV
uniref:Major facilitator superfamily (MFS) profile domain-containing protein n=1 Tax=Psilocybe cubensis TaxID=181762 RepID=A0A8H7XWD9_PSICU